MAIRLWPHVLRTAAPLTDPPLPSDVFAWFAGERVLQHRDRSEWNPPATPPGGGPASDEAPEPHWPDTQPWCHD
jgi:hypothetical protein